MAARASGRADWVRELRKLQRTYGRAGQARTWYERAVEAKRQGDLHGRVDHGSLAVSMRERARCAQEVGRVEEAKQWDEAASAEDSKEGAEAAEGQAS